jgi:hypothetical protein
MADTVTSNVVLNSVRTDGNYTIHLTNLSDGTGESAVVKIDKSAFTAPDGAEPASIDIVSARWNIAGFSSVRLHWDHTTDDTALRLSGNGFDHWGDDGLLRDPRSAGETGDLMLTTVGAAANAVYDITLEVRML